MRHLERRLDVAPLLKDLVQLRVPGELPGVEAHPAPPDGGGPSLGVSDSVARRADGDVVNVSAGRDIPIMEKEPSLGRERRKRTGYLEVPLATRIEAFWLL